MKIFTINPISFGYKSILKTHWLESKMPSVKYGFYGGKLTKDNITLEHILPHSKGGRTTMANLALSQNVKNWERADKPLIQFFNKEAFEQYCEQFKGIKLPFFNGDEYVKQIVKTVQKLLKQGK